MSTAPGDLNLLPLPELYRSLEATGLIRRLLELARDEDLGCPPDGGDITSLACPEPLRDTTGRIVVREACRVAGLDAVPTLLEVFAPSCHFASSTADGDTVAVGDTLGTITGPRSQVLTAERTLLNMLGRLCGIATLTAKYDSTMRAAAPGCAARLLDTRKTTPGLRVLEKYAVRCGGGLCHRFGLHDAVLIKDNHIAGVPLDALARYVADASQRARSLRPVRFIEVEVDSLEQLDVVLSLPQGTVDFVLLDNMPLAQLQDAVTRRNRSGRSVLLEASGGITLNSIGGVAAAGVDRISVGALTRHARCIDIALDVI